MKIALLSRNPKLYSTRRLKEAALERGHEIQVIDVLRAYMNIASHKPTIHSSPTPIPMLLSWTDPLIGINGCCFRPLPE